MSMINKNSFAIIFYCGCCLSLFFDLPKEILLTSKNMLILYNVDSMLCFLFGNLARWYQLHSSINFYITYLTFNDYLSYLLYPIQSFVTKDTFYIGNLIICLHTYHILMFNNLNISDYFHHILFVGLGALPNMIWFRKNNIINLLYFTGCGLTGSFEYLLLSLKKNDLISRFTQKKITSLIYNYIRFPLSLYSICMIYLHYHLGNLKNYEYKISFTILLSFFNASYYNYLTLISFSNIN